MYEICFTIIDIADSAALAELDRRLRVCLSTRGCHRLATDCTLPGKIFAVGEIGDEAHALAAANHLAACVGRECPMIVEVSELGTANQILRRTVVEPLHEALEAAE